MKKIFSLILTLALLVTLCSVTTFAFAEDETTNVAVTGVKFSTNSATRIIGDKDNALTVTATVEPSNASNKNVTYSVQDGKTGISVDSEGKVTIDDGAAAGDYVIVATTEETKEGVPFTAEFTLHLRAKFDCDETKLMDTLNKDAAFADLKWEMSGFKLPQEWLEDSDLIAEIFPGINYKVDGNDGYDKEAKYDQIYVEYCRPSESTAGKDSWEHSVKITESISISTSGWWKFRIVVKDGTDDSKVLCRSTTQIVRYAEDTTHPVVELSSDMTKKRDEGLTSGVTYTVSTSLNYPDDSNSSSKTVTYVINKKVNGEWVKIYDSVSREVTKGYEAFVSTSGVITPSDADITADKTAVYQIVYSVVDSYGFHGVASEDTKVEHNPTLELFVKAADSDSKGMSTTQIVQIILYVIAGLSFVGIIVLFFVKPKQATETGRVARGNKDEAEDTDNSEENK